jgi:dipeptidyl aminopeptidase/acylaminoacyl peptidase
MKRSFILMCAVGLICAAQVNGQNSVTIERVLRAPFPANLVAAKAGSRIAWTLNQEGKRNIWVADGPAFSARQLTSYDTDDGGELEHLRFSEDGAAIVYARGEEKNSAGEFGNPTSNPAGAEQAVWWIPFNGGAPVKIDAGSAPEISKTGVVAYEKSGQIWSATTKPGDKPRQIVVRGKDFPVAWSPDSARLLFLSSRGDHSFVGIYDAAAQSVKFVAPSVDFDSDPVWSLDGKMVAFVRRPSEKRDSPNGYFIEPDRPHPWAIWVGDAEKGTAREIWHSHTTPEGSFPYMAAETGGGVLRWAAKDTLIFASEEDGWQHLYAIPAQGGTAKLLTPGNCEVEQWGFSPDKLTVLFNSNCDDVDRRHIWKVAVDGTGRRRQTPGGGTSGIEWNPVILGNNVDFAYFGSDATHPGRLFHSALAADGAGSEVQSGSSGEAFPSEKLVVPQPVTFKSGDGLEIHGQLFVPRNLKAGERRPALIFLHGGPVRQMLLGWHYMYYYSNAYAMNQYLANRGDIVLAINYRSGIGYGRAFREAPGRAGRGATEYQDLVAAGKYLQSRNDVDAKRIGLWGGSYGGYLTALGLGRDSAIFAAGVDLHGVHDWPTDNWQGKNISPEMTKLAHDSSPVAAVDTWKSPVLFIHGDDDRNVFFSQTVDLVARLRPRGVHIEQLVFPDEVHDFLLYGNWLKAYEATSEFFDGQLGAAQK